MIIPGQRWGATPAELALDLPCDDEVSGSVVVCDRAISIDAPPPVVFAWLCQLRAAPYSYDLLDNWGRRSPRRRDPKLTELAVGQRFMSVFELDNFTPDAQITLRTGGVAVTYAVRPADTGSRLHARVLFRGPSWLLPPVIFGDFLMMRKQLLTLKELAEQENRAAV
ncbi:SRPBCC family protein [Nocardia sp. IFM 10818]